MIPTWVSGNVLPTFLFACQCFIKIQDCTGNDRESAKSLLAIGESSRDEALDVAHHAAWTIVASAILNLDETLTRE